MIVIAGAGLVGMTTAVLLATNGHNVALIDQRPAPGEVPDARALVLSPSSVECLQILGVWPLVAQRAEPITDIHVSQQRAFGTVRLSGSMLGLEALGWACPAGFLATTLGNLVNELAGKGANPPLALRWRTTLLDAVEDARGVRLTVESDGESSSMTSGVLIGADGTDSVVRNIAGLRTISRDYGQTAIVSHVDVGTPRSHTAYERFTARGPIAMIPCGGSRYVNVQCVNESALDEWLAMDDDDYAANLMRRFGGRLGELVLSGDRRAHSLHAVHTPDVSSGRVAVIGNAANTLHPNGAQGLNLGWRDARVLAEMLSAERSSDPSATLASYADERRADHQRVWRFTDFLALGFGTRLPGAPALRSLMMSMFDAAPPLKRRFGWQATGLAFNRI